MLKINLCEAQNLKDHPSSLGFAKVFLGLLLGADLKISVVF